MSCTPILGYYTEAKNVGKVNATTAKTQADAEAQAQWTKNVTNIVIPYLYSRKN